MSTLVFYSDQCIVPKIVLHLKFQRCLDIICELFRPMPVSLSSLSLIPSLPTSFIPFLLLHPLPLPVSLSPSQPFKIPLAISIIMSIPFLSMSLFLFLNFYSALSQKPPTETFKKCAYFLSLPTVPMWTLPAVLLSTPDSKRILRTKPSVQGSHCGCFQGTDALS